MLTFDVMLNSFFLIFLSEVKNEKKYCNTWCYSFFYAGNTLYVSV